MEFKEYRELTKVTWVRKATSLEDGLHMVLGISGEIAEIAQANILAAERHAQGDKNPFDLNNIREEIGDLMWYVANYFNTFDIDNLVYDEIAPIYSPKYEMVVVAGNLTDLFKKWFAYGKEPSRIQLEGHIQSVVQVAHNLCLYFQLEMSNVMEVNINKLRVRYGDKFDAHKAINRDLEAERQALGY